MTRTVQLLAKRFEFVESRGDVAQNGGNPNDSTLIVEKREDSELDGHGTQVFQQCWNRKNIAGPVPGRP